MRITGYLTEHGVLDLVSTLLFHRRSCFTFFFVLFTLFHFMLHLCLICLFLKERHRSARAWFFSLVLIRLHTPKGLL